MDPRSLPEKEGPSSPAREAGPGHSDTPSSVISNTMPGDNQGNQQNVVGDHTMPILNIGGHVNMTFYSCLGEKSKSSENARGRIRILLHNIPRSETSLVTGLSVSPVGSTQLS